MIMTLKWNRRKKGGAERGGLTLFRVAVQFLLELSTTILLFLCPSKFSNIKTNWSFRYS